MEEGTNGAQGHLVGVGAAEVDGVDGTEHKLRLVEPAHPLHLFGSVEHRTPGHAWKLRLVALVHRDARLLLCTSTGRRNV